jgi:hypothetical protein
MRRLLHLAPQLRAGCTSPAPHTTEWSYAYQVSTSDIALGLLSAPDMGSFECRLDGELVEAEEAVRRIRELPSGESVRLALASGEATVEMVVGADGAIFTCSRGPGGTRPWHWDWRAGFSTTAGPIRLGPVIAIISICSVSWP